MIENINQLKDLIKARKNFKFKVKATANSRNNSIDFCDEYIKIKINAPAVDGKANKAIIEYLSECLDVHKSNISIVSGEKSTLKLIAIEF